MDFRENRREKLLFELSNAADSSKEGISALRFQREKDSKRVTGHSSYCSSTGVVPDGCYSIGNSFSAEWETVLAKIVTLVKTDYK